jgi:putative DNA primase/helicase
MQPRFKTREQAVGRWRSILTELDVPAQYLTGKHGPCPCCGGKDRFRFTDLSGNGTFFCNNCGPGSGFDLLMKIRGIDFIEARKLVDGVLPNAKVEIAKATAPRPFDPAHIWGASHPLTRFDPAGKYLASRGYVTEHYPTQLRYHPRVKYRHDDNSVTYHPAMVANFMAPDAARNTVHYTFLDEDGRKAELPKARKLAPAPIPQGGAVRLDYSAETMGIAEGIETALSAQQMFDVPVWAGLSKDGLIKWSPPQTARSIVIFGDNDASYTGQAAAYGLAHRLAQMGLNVAVKIPDKVDTDWNDVWSALRA